MPLIKSLATVLASGVLIITLQACTPEMGTDAWCSHMKEKSKADWSAEEAGAYGENCEL